MELNRLKQKALTEKKKTNFRFQHQKTGAARLFSDRPIGEFLKGSQDKFADGWDRVFGEGRDDGETH
jgi:hypothetical protein